MHFRKCRKLLEIVRFDICLTNEMADRDVNSVGLINWFTYLSVKRSLLSQLPDAVIMV